MEGTEGLIRIGNTQTEITILDGKVLVVNDEGTFLLTDGQSVVTEKEQALMEQTVVKPRDAEEGIRIGITVRQCSLRMAVCFGGRFLLKISFR